MYLIAPSPNMCDIWLKCVSNINLEEKNIYQGNDKQSEKESGKWLYVRRNIHLHTLHNIQTQCMPVKCI